MTKRLRQLVVTALMLALPMQAFASATMLRCAGADHAAWPDLVAGALSDRATADSPAAPDDGADRHEHATPAPAGYDGGAGPDGDHHSHGQCNFCSDCCGGAAIHSAGYPAPAMVMVPNGLIAMVAQAVSGRVPERLERPPRSLLV